MAEMLYLGAKVAEKNKDIARTARLRCLRAFISYCASSWKFSTGITDQASEDYIKTALEVDEMRVGISRMGRNFSTYSAKFVMD